MPIDFSEPSLQALRHAGHLAAFGDASLTLLNVIEEVPSFRTLDAAAQERKQTNERLARLESLARRELGPAITVRTCVREGSPAKEITREAAREGSDMIIVGRHEQHGLRRWFHGGTATRLIRLAHCPVMVLAGLAAC